MNDNDKKNLDFILYAPQKEFDAWMEEASMDDIDYALEIIRQSKVEIMMEQIELQDLAVMDHDDVSEARDILNKLKLK